MLFEPKNDLAEQLLKSIVIKTLSWLYNLGIPKPDPDLAIAGIELNVRDNGGFIFIPEEEVAICWTGVFPDRLDNIKVSREQYTDAINNLSEIIELERMFYGRLAIYEQSIVNDDIESYIAVGDKLVAQVNKNKQPKIE